MIWGDSIRGRLLRVLLLIAIVPLSALAVYVGLSTRSSINQAAHENLEDRTELAASTVLRKLDESIAAIEVLAANPVLASEAAVTAAGLEQLSIAQAIYPHFEDLTLVDRSGAVLASTNYIFRGRWETDSSFQQALAGESTISEPRWVPDPGRLVIRFLAPIRGPGGVSKVIAGQVSLDRIWLTLDAARIGDQGFVALVDANGNYLAHPDRTLVLTESTVGSAIAAPGTDHEQSGRSSVVLWHQVPLGVGGWTAVAVQPRSEIEASVMMLLRRIGAGLVVAVVIAVLGALFLSRALTLLVERLGESFARVSAGHLAERALPTGVREFDNLTRDFNAMAGSLEQSTLELSASEQRFRSLVTNATDFILLLDRDSSVTYASPSVERVLGFAPVDLLGRQLLDLIHAEDRSLVSVALQRVLGAAANTGSAEYRVRRGHDSWRVVESTISNLLDEPSVDGIVFNSRDITDRKQLEADVAAAQEVDRLKSEFVALASHELRTPMTGIYGFASLLASSDVLADQERGWATRIVSESDRLTGIISDMLSLSKIEFGGLEFERESIELTALVREIVDSLQLGELHQLGFEFDGPVVVEGDRGKLGQVISNLVDNAIKYSPTGGAVRVSVHVRADQAELTISDQGVGIPPDEIPKLFTRFHRIRRPELENIRSTGLGLYLVKQLVTGMDGQVEVESTEGVGSRFLVRLALATPGDRAEATASDAAG